MLVESWMLKQVQHDGVGMKHFKPNHHQTIIPKKIMKPETKLTMKNAPSVSGSRVGTVIAGGGIDWRNGCRAASLVRTRALFMTQGLSARLPTA